MISAFLLVVLLELVAVYRYLYPNLVLNAQGTNPVSEVRVNLPAYQSALSDLNRFQNYVLTKSFLPNPNPFLYQ